MDDVATPHLQRRKFAFYYRRVVPQHLRAAIGKTEIIEWARQAWTRQMINLDAEFAGTGGPYVCGDTFTIADIPVGLVVNRWFGVAFEKPDLPAVARYYERLSDRPGYRLYGRNGTP